MERRDAIVERIRTAFRATPFPGDDCLQGSFDGTEPYDEVRHFHGRDDWTMLDAPFLDARYCALSFLSEAGFRYYMPAYLIADLQGLLMTADPAFHLTHGFFDASMEQVVGGEQFVRRLGPDVLVNPRRYGAMTWADQARHRLSVFAREEAQAIVAYLRCRHASADTEAERRQLDQALDAFWLERAATAPTAAALAEMMAEEARHAAALVASAADVPRVDGDPCA